MPISIHAASAPIFTRMLTNLSTWLDKAEAHAAAKKFDKENYLGLRLTPDMLPFARQIQIATDTAKLAIARLAGAEAPKWPDDEKTFAELRARVKKALDYVQSVPAAKLEGGESRAIDLPMGPGRTLKVTGEAMLAGFSLPNFFFHVMMVYTLLRQGGVELGKMDYLGAPPS
ncbi:MAG TPA: DUF1993 domain-containing protein [Myxococcota bacterium]|nr:DUF1993 domain-containing protein [Myxococcota bacterium]